MTTVGGLRTIVHLQDRGDVHVPAGTYAGTRGESRRVEGFSLLPSSFPEGVTAEYMAHLQGTGDTPWMQAGEFCGSRGEGRRLEGIAVRLRGPNADRWSVRYYVHVQNFGDIGPASERNGQPIPREIRPARDGEYSGTRGRSLRVEGLEVWLVPVVDDEATGPLPVPDRPTRDPGYVMEPSSRYPGGFKLAHTFVDPTDPAWLLIYAEGIPASGLAGREPVRIRWNPVTGATEGPARTEALPEYLDPRPQDGRPWKALRYVRDPSRSRRDHRLYVRRSADRERWQEKVALRGADIHDTTFIMGHYPENPARGWSDEYILAVRPRFPRGHLPARTIAIARSPWWWDHGAWMGRWNGTEDLFMQPDSAEPPGVELHNVVAWRRDEGGPQEETLLLVVVLHWSRGGATGRRADTTEVRLAVTRDRFRSFEWLYDREPYLERRPDRPMIWPYAPVWYQPTSEVLFPFVESTAHHNDEIDLIGPQHHQSIGMARLRVTS